MLFRSDFKPMNYLLYSKNRALLANLRYYDKSLEQYLNFGTTGWENYINYQGDLTPIQIASCDFTSASANTTLVMTGLPTISPALYAVRAGDFLQVGRYSYIATQDVVMGSSGTVNIPVHRILLTPITTPIPAVIGQYGTTVSMGGNTYTGITFPVILQQYPTYTLIPMTNDSFIAWSNTFKAFESVL